MMNMYKFPYRFEPGPEIADRLNVAWFDEHYGEERMKEHIRKHKLKSHQYKCYVNYWWLKDRKWCGIISTNYVNTTMDNDQLLEEMEVQAELEREHFGILYDSTMYDDATYSLEIDYTTQS